MATSDSRIGQKFGDALSVGQGAIEMGLGAGVAEGSASGGVVTSSTGVGAVAGAAGAIGGIVISAHGANTMYNGFNNMLNADGNNSGAANENANTGKRRKNRIPDQGKPNTVAENPSGTTMKKYGDDGWVQKEFNKGHAKDSNPKGLED
ncbi:hypothetical protein, partial [Fulvivirga kasyanovii]